MMLCHLCWKAVSEKISTKSGNSDDAFVSYNYSKLNRDESF